MTELIEFLKNEKEESAKAAMKGTYWEAYSQIKLLRAARSKDGVNS